MKNETSTIRTKADALFKRFSERAEKEKKNPEVKRSFVQTQFRTSTQHQDERLFKELKEFPSQLEKIIQQCHELEKEVASLSNSEAKSHPTIVETNYAITSTHQELRIILDNAVKKISQLEKEAGPLGELYFKPIKKALTNAVLIENPLKQELDQKHGTSMRRGSKS